MLILMTRFRLKKFYFETWKSDLMKEVCPCVPFIEDMTLLNYDVDISSYITPLVQAIHSHSLHHALTLKKLNVHKDNVDQVKRALDDTLRHHQIQVSEYE